MYQDNESKQMLQGIIGALVGALIGAVIWVLLFQTGFIFSIVGAAISVLTIIGYQKMAGDLDQRGLVISIVISLIAVVVANFMGWSVFLHRELQSAGYGMTFMEVASDVFDIVKELGVAQSFFKGLIKSILYAVVGTILFTRRG